MFELVMSLPEVTIVTPQQFTWALHLPQFTSEIGLWVMSQATLPALLRESNSFQARSCSWRTRTLPQLHLQEATWSFKSIPSLGRDIWLHTTRQCLSPFRIQTAAWCLKLCFIVLCCCCLCCFCVSCCRWHKRQGLEHLTKRSIHLLSISRALRQGWNYATREDPEDLSKLLSIAWTNWRFLRDNKGGE